MGFRSALSPSATDRRRTGSRLGGSSQKASQPLVWMPCDAPGVAIPVASVRYGRRAQARTATEVVESVRPRPTGGSGDCMDVLVLGISGMLGSMVFRLLGERPGWRVVGTARSPAMRARFPAGADIRTNVAVDDLAGLAGLLRDVRPKVVINCIGVVKQAAASRDPLLTLPDQRAVPASASAPLRSRRHPPRAYQHRLRVQRPRRQLPRERCRRRRRPLWPLEASRRGRRSERDHAAHLHRRSRTFGRRRIRAPRVVPQAAGSREGLRQARSSQA